MQTTTYLRLAFSLVGLTVGSAAMAQHPAANPLNWRTVHPEKAQDYIRSIGQQPSADQLLAPNDSVLFIKGGAYGGRLLRTTDRGLTWETPSTTAAPTGRLQFFSAQAGVVMYDSSAALPARVRGQVRFTIDGGATWGVPRAAPTGWTTFLSPTEGLVFQSRPANELLVYRTINAGQTWSVLDSLTGLPALGPLSAPSANTAYMLSSDSLTRQVIQLALGRHTWRVRPLPAATGPLQNGGIRQIHFNDDSVGQARDESNWNQRIFTTSNGGRTWSAMPAPSMTGGVNNVFALIDNQHVLLHDEFPTQQQDMYQTANAGQSWQAVPMTDFTAQPAGPGDFYQQNGLRSGFAYCLATPLVMRPSGVAWAVGEGGRIYYSTNFGTSFTMRSRVLLADRPAGFGFPDPSHGWVASVTDGLLRTTDGGETWARVSHPGVAAYDYIRTTAFPDADTLFLATDVGLSNSGAKLYRSTNGGQTWTTPSVPTTRTGSSLQSICFVDGARRGIAVGDYGTIVRTTDGGQTWQAATSSATAKLISIAWAGLQTVFVAGGQDVLKSTDGGVTWLPLTTLPHPLLATESVHSLAFPSAQLGFMTITGRPVLGAQYDSLYRTANGGLTWHAVPGMAGGALSFASPRDGMGLVQATQDSGRTWTYFPYNSPTYAVFGGSPLMMDADNGFLLSTIGSGGQDAAAAMLRYSKHFLRAAPLSQTTLTAGASVSVAFTMTGTFTAAERDFRVELSNPMGRFRRGQILTIGRGAASPITAQLPAALPPGTHYRLRVVRADSSVLGTDTGQDLLIQAPSGLAADALAMAAPLLYPNPAQHTVMVSFPDGARPGRQVRLLDLVGRLVLATPATAAELRLNLVGLAPGCYLLQTQLPGGQRSTQRLVVQP